MKRLLAVGAAVCALGPIADALGGQEAAGVHLEGGYQHLFVDGASVSSDEFALRVPDHSYGVLMVRGGYDVLPFVTLEAEAMVGVADSDPTIETSLGDIPVEARIEYGLAAFGKFRFSPSGGVSIHARIGVSSITGETSAPGNSESGTSDGLAYGVGGEIEITDSIGLRLDLTQYRDGDDEFNAVAVTVVNHF
ncbi:MAG: porin family protein [Rhodospirillaceae bacterium]|nr:porin family protein [Rhodospirillaceae bacterium]